MNFDGATKTSTLAFQKVPLYVALEDMQFTVDASVLLSLPVYNKSSRVIPSKCILSINLQYRFTDEPLLFTLQVMDRRTQSILGSSPYGQEDFSLDVNTMTEQFMLEFWDDEIIEIRLLFREDEMQKFVLKKNSFIKVDVI